MVFLKKRKLCPVEVYLLFITIRQKIMGTHHKEKMSEKDFENRNYFSKEELLELKNQLIEVFCGDKKSEESKKYKDPLHYICEKYPLKEILLETTYDKMDGRLLSAEIYFDKNKSIKGFNPFNSFSRSPTEPIPDKEYQIDFLKCRDLDSIEDQSYRDNFLLLFLFSTKKDDLSESQKPLHDTKTDEPAEYEMQKEVLNKEGCVAYHFSKNEISGKTENVSLNHRLEQLLNTDFPDNLPGQLIITISAYLDNSAEYINLLAVCELSVTKCCQKCRVTLNSRKAMEIISEACKKTTEEHDFSNKLKQYMSISGAYQTWKNKLYAGNGISQELAKFEKSLDSILTNLYLIATDDEKDEESINHIIGYFNKQNLELETLIKETKESSLVYPNIAVKSGSNDPKDEVVDTIEEFEEKIGIEMVKAEGREHILGGFCREEIEFFGQKSYAYLVECDEHYENPKKVQVNDFYIGDAINEPPPRSPFVAKLCVVESRLSREENLTF